MCYADDGSVGIAAAQILKKLLFRTSVQRTGCLVEQQLTNDGHTHVRFMRPLLMLIRWVVPAGILIIFLNELIPLIIK